MPSNSNEGVTVNVVKKCQVEGKELKSYRTITNVPKLLLEFGL